MELKLYVKPSENCLTAVKYLSENITKIVKMGVKINIKKLPSDIDEKTAELLKKLGIQRLPAMITKNNKKFFGIDEIRGLIEKNLREFNAANSERSARPEEARPEEFGSNPDLADFWRKTVALPKDGKRDEDMESETKDMMAQLSKYKAPAHRKTQMSDSDTLGNIAAQAQEARSRRYQQIPHEDEERPRQVTQDDRPRQDIRDSHREPRNEDNITTESEYERISRSMRETNYADPEPGDDVMMAAMLDKIGGSNI